MDQTLKNLELSASLRPDFISAHAQLAYTKFNYGKRFNDKQAENEAKDKFKMCLEKFPDSGEVHFLYAQVSDPSKMNVRVIRIHYQKLSELFLYTINSYHSYHSYFHALSTVVIVTFIHYQQLVELLFCLSYLTCDSDADNAMWKLISRIYCCFKHKIAMAFAASSSQLREFHQGMKVK